MPTSIRSAFKPQVVMLKVASLVPSRRITARERKEHKYRQIETSFLSVGMVEPVVVFPLSKGEYRLLDGHKRVDILIRRTVSEVECLLATDDEAYTYNKRVNYLSSVGEHQMILQALKHNTEHAIAKALAVNVRTIRAKRDLLVGICKEAIELLKDRRISPKAFLALKKMKPLRQLEVAQLMVDSNRYSETFAEALLAGTRADMLVKPTKVYRSSRTLSADEKIGLERETDALLHDFKAVEASYGADVLALSVSCRYVSRILASEKVRHYIEGRFQPDSREMRPGQRETAWPSNSPPSVALFKTEPPNPIAEPRCAAPMPPAVCNQLTMVWALHCTARSVILSAIPPMVTTYRVRTPLKALAGKPLIDTVIPAGSTIEWQAGDYAGGMASVFWLRQRILVMEAELFTHCERLRDGRGS